VQVDKSRMLTISGAPGAIVIGNPSIADVTTNGDKVFVHGRNFGETNLLILDLQGNTIAEFDLITRHSNDPAVAVYKASDKRAASRESFSCYPLCEADMQVGDDIGYFKRLIEEASDKTQFATGSETSEAQAPAAPQ
jgi:Pilus formation protein N terminal region